MGLEADVGGRGLAGGHSPEGKRESALLRWLCLCEWSGSYDRHLGGPWDDVKGSR